MKPIPQARLDAELTLDGPPLAEEAATGAAGSGDGYVAEPASVQRGLEGAEPMAEAMPTRDRGGHAVGREENSTSGVVDQPAGAQGPGGEPPPAEESLTYSALAYLNGLDLASRQALHSRLTARLAEQGAWLTHPMPPMRSLGDAIEFPPDVISRLHRDALALARAHADELAAFTAAWYARTVVAACRAIWAGRYLNGHDLEGEVFDPAELPRLLSASAEDPIAPPWRPQYLPDLLDPAELVTGREDLDRTMADIHQQLTMAYTAARTAEVLGDISNETDPSAKQLAVLDQAVQLADQVPDLLISWASTVATTLYDERSPNE